jgi:hypothetical protein
VVRMRPCDRGCIDPLPAPTGNAISVLKKVQNRTTIKFSQTAPSRPRLVRILIDAVISMNKANRNDRLLHNLGPV